MYRLLKNELQKVFAQKKMYVFGAIIVVWVVLLTLVSYIGIVNQGAEGQSFPYDNLGLMADFLYPIFAIVLLAELISEELSTGTFKLFLVHPVSRNQLLRAKLLAIAILIFVLMLVSIVTSYITGTVTFGWGESFKIGGQIMSSSQGVFWTFGAYIISLMAIMAFVLLITPLALELEGSGAVVGALIGIYFAISIVRIFAAELRPVIILTYFRFYDGIFTGMDWKSIVFGSGIMFIYGLIGYLVSVKILKKKDFI